MKANPSKISLTMFGFIGELPILVGESMVKESFKTGRKRLTWKGHFFHVAEVEEEFKMKTIILKMKYELKLVVNMTEPENLPLLEH
jgi:hypothetical protein